MKQIVFFCFASIICNVASCSPQNDYPDEIILLVQEYDSLIMNVTGDSDISKAYTTYIDSLYINTTSNSELINKLNHQKEFYRKAIDTFEKLNLVQAYFLEYDSVLWAINPESDLSKSIKKKYNNEFIDRFFKGIEASGAIGPHYMSQVVLLKDILSFEAFEDRLCFLNIMMVISNMSSFVCTSS